MKATLKILAVVFGLAISNMWTASAANPTFTITPSAISNTYAGNITLQINGIATNDTVLVQRWLDVNSNGVVDAGDILVRSFYLTDNKAVVFSGVTNLSVPGDLNPGNGVITTVLNALDNGIVPQFIGNNLLVLSSTTTNHFTSVTNTLLITNYPFAQGVSGQVTNGGSGVPYAPVLLFQAAGGNLNPMAGIVSDASGNYSIKAPPGSYLVASAKSNYVANLSASPTVTILAGVSVVTNIPAQPATQFISGRLTDTNTGAGLAGVLLPLESTNNQLAVGWTDTNGYFTIPAVPSQWKIQANENGLSFLGYLKAESTLKVNTIGGSVSSVSVALEPGSAMFYGKIRDNLGNPMPQAVVSGNDDIGAFATKGISDINGNYFAMTSTNGQWFIGAASGQMVAAYNNYVFSAGNNQSLGAGQAVQQDIFALPAPYQISGTVSNNTGIPLSNVSLFANYTINGTNYQANNTSTDNNGNYSFSVSAGNWDVGVNCSGNSSLGNIGYDCVNDIFVNINKANGTADFVAYPAGTYQLSGYLLNASTSQPITNITIHATGNSTSIFTTTDINGSYNFGLGNGTYTISADCSGLSGQGYLCPSSIQATISGTNSANNNIYAQPPSLQITSPLASGMVNIPYYQQLSGSGGVPPYTWSFISGSLPSGINIFSNGVISGTPLANGTFDFTLQLMDSHNSTAVQQFSLFISNSPPQDISYFYVYKERVYSQINSSGFAPVSPSTFVAGMGIFQSGIGTVLNANAILPTGNDVSFSAGPSAPIELRATNLYSSQAALDVGVPPGSYAFVINGTNNGLELLSVSLPSSSNYPVPSLITDFTALQSVSASSPVNIQWQTDSGGPNDFVWFYLTAPNGSTVFSSPYPNGAFGALTGTSNSTTIPAGTLQSGTTYQGLLVFIRGVSTNAAGNGGAYLDVATVFPLVTTSVISPVLAPITYTNPGGFKLSLTGVISKTYVIQASTNLTTWTNLFTNTLSITTIQYTDPQATTNKSRFYRAFQQGP